MINKETVPHENDSRLSLIQNAEREIYENITQCICLAKMQIASVDLERKESARAYIGEATLLLGKAVKDLRKLAKQLSVSHL